LRSLDDEDVNDIGYDSMIAQSKGDQSSQQTSDRQVQMTTQRQQSKYSQRVVSDSDDWAAKELKHDIEADGYRQVVEIINTADIDDRVTDISNTKYQRINRIKRPR
jgi:hypothetical protein